MEVRQLVFATLCLLQLLGVCGSVVAAAIEIELIIFTGPAFSLLGLIVVFGWRIRRSAQLVVFGGSASVMSLFLFVLINACEWGPNDAELPVMLILLGYELVIVPIGILGFYQTVMGSRRDPTERVWQFNLRTLLTVTLVAATACAAARLTLGLNPESRTESLRVVSVAFCVATILTVGWVAVRIRRVLSHYGPWSTEDDIIDTDAALSDEGNAFL